MLKILFENDDFIGFDKPTGLPTTVGASSESLVAQVRAEHPELFNFSGFNEDEGGLLYRLDNETSGLVLFAKNREAFERFQDDPELEKVYAAQVEHFVSLPKSGVIHFAIAHKSKVSMIAVLPGKKQHFRGNAQAALTRFEKGQDGWIHCFIRKGMRHQIRVHLAAIGHAILGDPLYGSQSDGELQLRCVGVKSGWLNIEPL